MTTILPPANAQDENSLTYGSIASGEPCSIADRAKTRRRTQMKTKTALNNSITQLTSENNEGPSARSVISPLPYIAHESAHPRPRPRPRPKLITKHVRAHLDSDPLPPHPYPSARNPLQYEMPAVRQLPASTPPPLYRHELEPLNATSPSAFDPGKSLPPSDPPNPTLSTPSDGKLSQLLPPIEIFQGRESYYDRDSRASSPSSLFSDRSSGSKKMKSGTDKRVGDDEEIDQLMSSPSRARPVVTSHHKSPTNRGYNCGGRLRREEAQDIPPPTFFAGSSSSSADGNNEPKHIVTPHSQVEVVDLTDLPPTMDLAIAPHDNSSTSRKLPKPKKQKNTKAMNPDPDLDFGSIVMRDDDDKDDDFDPQNQTHKKTKGKRKGKDRAKQRRVKKANATKSKAQLEVVILRPKSMSKGQEMQGEEIFKSQEFIEDSDEVDDDPLLLVGNMEQERSIVTEPKSGELTAPMHFSTNQGPANTTPAYMSKTSTAIPSTLKERRKARGKKRKSIQESDQESERDIYDQEESIVVKKRKNMARVVLDDEQAGMEEVELQMRTGDRKKKGKGNEGQTKRNADKLADVSGEEGQNGIDNKTRPDADIDQQHYRQDDSSAVIEDKNTKTGEKVGINITN